MSRRDSQKKNLQTPFTPKEVQLNSSNSNPCMQEWIQLKGINSTNPLLPKDPTECQSLATSFQGRDTWRALVISMNDDDEWWYILARLRESTQQLESKLGTDRAWTQSFENAGKPPNRKTPWVSKQKKIPNVASVAKETRRMKYFRRNERKYNCRNDSMHRRGGWIIDQRKKTTNPNRHAMLLWCKLSKNDKTNDIARHDIQSRKNDRHKINQLYAFDIDIYHIICWGGR